MTFIEDYNFLKSYSGSIVQKLRISAEPEELINEAYIKIAESGVEYSRGAAISHIIKSAYSFVSDKNRLNQLHDYGDKLAASRSQGHFTCSVCKDVYPDMMFYRKLVAGVSYPLSYCKDCYNKKSKDWVGENREAWNKYMRERRFKLGIGSGLTREEYLKQCVSQDPRLVKQREAQRRYLQRKRLLVK